MTTAPAGPERDRGAGDRHSVGRARSSGLHRIGLSEIRGVLAAGQLADERYQFGGRYRCQLLRCELSERLRHVLHQADQRLAQCQRAGSQTFERVA
jgi:hypothetical protein